MTSHKINQTDRKRIGELESLIPNLKDTLRFQVGNHIESRAKLSLRIAELELENLERMGKPYRQPKDNLEKIRRLNEGFVYLSILYLTCCSSIKQAYNYVPKTDIERKQVEELQNHIFEWSGDRRLK